MNIKNHIKLFFITVLVIFSSFSCKNKTDKNLVRLFAAAGTMLPSNEICNQFELVNNLTVEKNYAASGNLARQINAGAEADLFISANKQWIDYLKEQKLIIDSSIIELAYNKLVVICSIDKVINLEFNKDFDISSAINDKISIGDPKYVPAGKYAKQILDMLSWYPKIQDQIILAKDVTSVLNYVELGECDWGIVYYSEALKSDKVKIMYEIPSELHDPIIFYLALLNNYSNSKLLYSYFKSTESQRSFEKFGFSLNKP